MCCFGLAAAFAEVRQTQGLGRLILALFAQAGNHQNNDRHHIGQHLEQFLPAAGQTGNVQVQDVKSAEEE